ncbi:MAG: hypothetical protein R3208_02040 [Ketobacteraceae bacterium]|nr:hypothetical protein [Ketobacteraceae bacterium]
MKIVGIIFGILIALVVLWMGFGFVWWQSNHEEVRQLVDQAMEEGRTIGQDSTDQECLDTYLGIMKDCKEMTCTIQNQVFLKTCLQHSSPTGTLCAGTPAQDELLDLARWATEVCLDRNIENPNCAAGLQEVALYCVRLTPEN